MKAADSLVFVKLVDVKASNVPGVKAVDSLDFVKLVDVKASDPLAKLVDVKANDSLDVKAPHEPDVKAGDALDFVKLVDVKTSGSRDQLQCRHQCGENEGPVAVGIGSPDYDGAPFPKNEVILPCGGGLTGGCV